MDIIGIKEGIFIWGCFVYVGGDVEYFVFRFILWGDCDDGWDFFYR